MAVITKDTFDPLRRYVGVRLQQGVPIVDADWNEMEDARRFELRAFLKWFVGDGVPDGNDGFRVVGDGADGDFLISAALKTDPTDGLANVGRILVDGLDVIIPADIRFSEQPLHASKGASATALAQAWKVPVIAPFPQPRPPIPVSVYLDVWERLVTPAEDPSLVHPGLGTESCARRKREWAVRVALGPAIPTPGSSDFVPGHSYLRLAQIEWLLDRKITPDRVRDTRRRGLTLTSIDARLSAVQQTLNGGDIGPRGIFTRYVGINTDNQTASLAVEAPDITQAAYFRKATAGTHYSHALYGPKGDWYIRSASDTGMVCLQDHAGRVGIGTPTPQAKLQVKGGAIMPEVGNSENAGIMFPKDPGGGSADLAFLRYSVESGESTTLRLGIQNDADDSLRLYQAGADRVIIQNGQVTIGQATPYVGNEPRNLNVAHEIKAIGPLAGFRTQDRSNLDDAAREWVIYANANHLRFWSGLRGDAAWINYDTRSMHVAGTLSAGNKAFIIPHPQDPEGKELVHGALEGPETGVYYRGEAELCDGVATVELPAYFEALTRREGRTVQLTPIWPGPGKPCSALAASAVQDGRFSVHCIDRHNPSQRFYWEVKAVRADQPELVPERPKKVLR